jgi:hypothetical protein
MGVEPTQDGSTAPQTVLKTAPVTGPEAAPCAYVQEFSSTCSDGSKVKVLIECEI